MNFEFLYVTNKRDRNKDKVYKSCHNENGKVYRVKDEYAFNLQNLEKMYLDLNFNNYTLTPINK